MKRLLIMISAILFLAAACIAPAYAKDAATGKTLILYYSRTGNTKAACEALGKALNADIREVKDRNSRDAGFGSACGMLKIFLGMQTDTDPEKIDFAAYKTIIVSAPIWAAQPGLAMKTFIQNNRFEGKNVIMFITADSFIEEKYQVKHKALLAESGGNVIDYYQVQATDLVNKEKVPRSKEKIAEEALKLVPDVQKVIAGK